MTTLEHAPIPASIGETAAPPILICLLGDFLLLKDGWPVTIRSGGKAESLLCLLGLRYGQRVAREALLSALWPDSDPALAGQSLNSLVYSLNKQLADTIEGAAVLHSDGY